MNTTATQDDPTPARRGRLNLSRYVGESVLIYPKPQFNHLQAQTLFSAPIEIFVEHLESTCAHFRVSADRRLVVVRDEIFKRNRQFQPQSTWTHDALRRAFFDIARESLDEHTFERLYDKALQRIS